MTNFSEISASYERDSLVQRSASDQLFDLIKIEPFEDVLDVGCGTGNLTVKIVEQTKGKIAGLDASEGMIDQAIQNYSHLGIEFEVCPAEKITYQNVFNVIFCNSTFQWFKNPRRALEACRNALKPGGRMGIQAPARNVYSPNFVKAVDKVKVDPWLGKLFSSFQSPWYFLETPEEYAELFERAGFEVLHSRIDRIMSSYTPDEVYSIFDSGAAAGYLNQEFYGLPISDTYIYDFRKKIQEAFADQAKPDGCVDLTFFRIYLLARKPPG
jgi:ubiquinone/menaquinone biosynthesis C-methylase UbiE